ncbi:MAG: hypothetical protein OXI94_10145 [Gemmatimonadota bacterium]|nr:hypothetical protein [Gemmatimonadota bacterium]
MKPENKPLSPEWLRRLRDTNSEKGPKEAQDRREAALQLAKRFGLKISKSAAA